MMFWAPSHATSFDFNYFVTFIYEFPRHTQVHLMKDKSELISIFMSFFNVTKNQFGKIIKILKSEHAKEYSFVVLHLFFIFPRNFILESMSSHSTTK